MTLDEKLVGPTVIRLDSKFPVAPVLVYELPSNGAKIGEVTASRAKDGRCLGAVCEMRDLVVFTVCKSAELYLNR